MTKAKQEQIRNRMDGFVKPRIKNPPFDWSRQIDDRFAEIEKILAEKDISDPSLLKRRNKIVEDIKRARPKIRVLIEHPEGVDMVATAISTEPARPRRLSYWDEDQLRVLGPSEIRHQTRLTHAVIGADLDDLPNEDTDSPPQIQVEITILDMHPPKLTRKIVEDMRALVQGREDIRTKRNAQSSARIGEDIQRALDGYRETFIGRADFGITEARRGTAGQVEKERRVCFRVQEMADGTITRQAILNLSEELDITDQLDWPSFPHKAERNTELDRVLGRIRDEIEIRTGVLNRGNF